MVHGNARVYLSLVHSVAEELNGGPLAKVDEYGYTPRGKASIDVPALRLGSATFEGIRAVPVFDFTDRAKAPVQGMLGTRFLTGARAAVDFTSSTLLLGVAPSGEPDAGLLARGYRAVPTVALPDGRMTIDVFFPAIERAIPITLSTVADAVMLHRPLFDGAVPMRPAGLDHSPSRTSPAVFSSSRVAFEVEGSAFEAPATLQDLAEYGSVEESELTTFGMLGFDWMRANGAVLDYANRRLYVRRSS